jgi:hypothetical protein
MYSYPSSCNNGWFYVDFRFCKGKDLRFQKVPTYEALGSGTMAVLSAMVLGHTAEEACWAATKSDLYSGGDIRVYSLDGKGFTVWSRDAV